MPPRKSRKRHAQDDDASSSKTEKEVASSSKTEKNEVASLKKELTAEKKETKDLRIKLAKSENQVESQRNVIADLRLKASMEEQLRLSMLRERKDMEQRHAKELLQMQQSRLLLEKKLEESEKKFQGRVDKEVQDKFGQDLQNETDNTTFYRQELLDLAKRLQEEREEEGVVFPWKKCEKCKGLYTANGKKIPRVLDCGHTYCEECLKKLCKTKKIVCPADKTVHNLTATLKDLPINKLVLSM